MNRLFEYGGKAAGIAAIYGASNLGIDYIAEKTNADWLHKELFEVGNFDIEVDDLMALIPFAFIWFAVRK